MISSEQRKLIEDLFESFHAIKLKMVGCSSGSLLSVTPSQGLVLNFVERENGAGIGKIAEHLGVTSSAATQLVNGLVRKGYLIRRENLDDRRELTVILSATGKKRMGLIRHERTKRVQSLFRALTVKEVREYCRLNKKIADSVGEEVK